MYFTIKRLFDLFVSITGLIICIIPMGIIALIIKLTSKGPVVYKHQRVGKHGKIFNVYKFRSMYDDNRSIENILDESKLKQFKEKHKVDDDPRITPFGRILRKSSLDELPQIFNIIKGDMAVIGPRPITSEELEDYKENKDFLLKVRPGLTGYWTTHGRSQIDNDIRIKMELYYVAKRSISMDVKIFFKTFVKLSTNLCLICPYI